MKINEGMLHFGTYYKLEKENDRLRHPQPSWTVNLDVLEKLINEDKFTSSLGEIERFKYITDENIYTILRDSAFKKGQKRILNGEIKLAIPIKDWTIIDYNSASYDEKTDDPRWFIKSYEIKKRDKFRCEGTQFISHCGNKGTVVHHQRYYICHITKKYIDPWDELYDKTLITLCNLCHFEEHRMIKYLNGTLTEEINVEQMRGEL